MGVHYLYNNYINMLAIDSLSVFGDMVFTGLTKFNDNFICDTGDEFKLKELCMLVLSGNSMKVNTYQFNNILFKLMNKDNKKINQIIFDSYVETMYEIHKMLNDQIMTKKFSLSDFAYMYNNLNKCSTKLDKLLKIYVNKFKQYSFAKIYKNVVFYRYIIDVEYEYEDMKCHIYEILCDLIDNSVDEIDFFDVITIFKMTKFYEKFSYYAKNKRTELFNIERDNEHLRLLGSNKILMTKIVNYIDSTIKSYENNKLNMLKSIIEICSSFKENRMFNYIYSKYLENRLLMKNVTLDLGLEKCLLETFSCDNDGLHVVQKMYYQIEDIENSMKIKKMYDNVNVSNISTTKYLDVGITLDDLKRELINFNVLRANAWDINTNPHKINIMPQLGIYIELFTTVFAFQYPNKNLKWNFEIGNAIVEMNFNSIDYQFLVTTPQLLVLYMFNDKKMMNSEDILCETHKCISIKDIQGILGVPMNYLVTIINSLLKAKLFVTCCDNARIRLNTDFSFKEKKINLSVLLDQSYSQPKISEKDLDEIYALNRMHIVACAIIKCLKHNKNMHKKDIIIEISQSIHFAPTNDNMDNALKWAIEKNCIKSIDNETYSYIDEDIEEENESKKVKNNISSENIKLPTTVVLEYDDNESSDNDIPEASIKTHMPEASIKTHMPEASIKTHIPETETRTPDIYSPPKKSYKRSDNDMKSAKISSSKKSDSNTKSVKISSPKRSNDYELDDDIEESEESKKAVQKKISDYIRQIDDIIHLKHQKDTVSKSSNKKIEENDLFDDFPQEVRTMKPNDQSDSYKISLGDSSSFYAQLFSSVQNNMSQQPPRQSFNKYKAKPKMNEGDYMNDEQLQQYLMEMAANSTVGNDVAKMDEDENLEEFDVGDELPSLDD